MIRKISTLDFLLHKTTINDCPEITPNPAVEDRLIYYFLLKQPAKKIKSNSIISITNWAFSLKGIALKTSIATACLVGALFMSNIRQSSNINIMPDSCQISPIIVDSNYLAKDTTLR
jgi:hypothetical protein